MAQHQSLTSPPNTPPSLTKSPSQERTEAPGSNAHVAYSPAFTDSLMKLILSQPAGNTPASSTSRRSANSSRSAKEDGIRVIPLSSNESPTRGASIRLQDIDPATLPSVAPEELPLSLDDPRRIYASGVPGIRLTHPGGWLEGGPGPAPPLPLQRPSGDTDNETSATAGAESQQASMPEFVRAFIEEHNAGTQSALKAAIAAQTAAKVEELRACMRERRDAEAKNERVSRELADLVAEREMERRVHERQIKVRQEQRERQGAAGATTG